MRGGDLQCQALRKKGARGEGLRFGVGWGEIGDPIKGRIATKEEKKSGKFNICTSIFSFTVVALLTSFQRSKQGRPFD